MRPLGHRNGERLDDPAALHVKRRSQMEFQHVRFFARNGQRDDQRITKSTAVHPAKDARVQIASDISVKLVHRPKRPGLRAALRVARQSGAMGPDHGAFTFWRLPVEGGNGVLCPRGRIHAVQMHDHGLGKLCEIGQRFAQRAIAVKAFSPARHETEACREHRAGGE